MPDQRGEHGSVGPVWRGLGLVRRRRGDLVPEDEQLDVFASRCAPSSNSRAGSRGVPEVGLSPRLRRSTSSTTSCRSWRWSACRCDTTTRSARRDRSSGSGPCRPEVEMVGVQMRHNGQIGAAGPVVGQRPPSPAQVPQPRAEQRVGEDTNAAVVDRAGRVPPPGDVRHLITSDSPSRSRVERVGVAVRAPQLPVLRPHRAGPPDAAPHGHRTDAAVDATGSTRPPLLVVRVFRPRRIQLFSSHQGP